MSVVTITLGRSLAETILPEDADFASLLGYAELEFRTIAGKINTARVRKQNFLKQNTGTVIFPAGTVPRVAEALRRNGHEVTIRDQRDLDREALQVDGADAEQAETLCPGLAACLAEHPEGILAVPRGPVRYRTIGVVCRLLPRARVFVACATRQVAADLAAELGHFVGGEVQAVSGGNWSSPCRVVCGTFTSFDRGQPSEWDVLLFEDAFEALGKRVHENRGGFSRQRVYGFIAPGTALSPKQQLQLEVLAGPVIYRHRSKPPRGPLVIEPVMASVADVHLPPRLTTREQRERLWADDRRNHTIAALANACAAGAPAPLWERGVFLAEANPFHRWPHLPRVTVVVESARHADQLAKLLPGWSLLTRRPGPAGSPAVARGLEQWAVPDRSIATAVRAAEYRTFDANILIMAAGGPVPLLPDGLLRRSGQLVVVDFDDYGSPILARDAAARRSQYDRLCQPEALGQPRTRRKHQRQQSTT